jgi:hypothetical protein
MFPRHVAVQRKRKEHFMIAKFDDISGNNLASLLTFVHSADNRVTILQQEDQQIIVRIKVVIPDNRSVGTWYGLTLEIMEWLPIVDKPGQSRVDPKYLLKVYEILGRNS